MHLCLGTTPALQRSMIFQRLRTGQVNRAAEVRLGASGKSINVARVLTLLGEDATATGFLGGDSGAFLRRDMDAAHIRHDFVPVAAPTRTCVTIIDRAGPTVTELVEEAGAVSPAEASAMLAKFRALLPQAKMLLLSGSLAAGVDEHFYADCSRAARAAGVPVIIDAKGAPLRHAIAHRPMIVKLNSMELAETLSIATETDPGVVHNHPGRRHLGHRDHGSARRRRQRWPIALAYPTPQNQRRQPHRQRRRLCRRPVRRHSPWPGNSPGLPPRRPLRRRQRHGRRLRHPPPPGCPAPLQPGPARPPKTRNVKLETRNWKLEAIPNSPLS